VTEGAEPVPRGNLTARLGDGASASTPWVVSPGGTGDFGHLSTMWPMTLRSASADLSIIASNLFFAHPSPPGGWEPGQSRLDRVLFGASCVGLDRNLQSRPPRWSTELVPAGWRQGRSSEHLKQDLVGVATSALRSNGNAPQRESQALFGATAFSSWSLLTPEAIRPVVPG
jgi:hypothetical protein